MWGGCRDNLQYAVVYLCASVDAHVLSQHANAAGPAQEVCWGAKGRIHNSPDKHCTSNCQQEPTQPRTSCQPGARFISAAATGPHLASVANREGQRDGLLVSTTKVAAQSQNARTQHCH